MLFEQVAVLGYGTMGRGITQVVAASGRTVTVYEADSARLPEGGAEVEASLDERVRRGEVSDQQRSDTLARIHTTSDLASLAGRGIELVIEAVVEDHGVKSALWPQVATVVGPDALLTTSTSTLSVTDLAAQVPDPARFAGLHFVNPDPLIDVVEVVGALQTDAAVMGRLEAFVVELGKSPVVVDDRPGFLVNRLLIPYLNDVIQAFDDGLATAEDLDTAVELGLGHRMGPLSMLDMIGLDVHHHASSRAHEQLHDPRFAPPPLLERMVAAGHLGEKSGRGFRCGGGLRGSHVGREGQDQGDRP